MGRRLLPAAFLVVLAGCPDDGTEGDFAEHPVSYFSTLAALDVEVAYEAGAEPYVGARSDGRPLWTHLGDNLEAIFEGRGVGIRVPMELAGMSEFPPQDRASWTVERIRGLALGLRSARGTGVQGRFIILFLDGRFDDGGGAVDDVLGIHVQGIPAVAVFKPAIRQFGTAVPGVAASLEQGVLIHELGHVLGLVDGGLPMVQPHEDPEHAGHCTNSACVMYWQLSAGAPARSFARLRLLSGSDVRFGPECLEDARSYHPRPAFGFGS